MSAHQIVLLLTMRKSEF